MTHVVQLDLFLLVADHEGSRIETKLVLVELGRENIVVVLLLPVTSCLRARLLSACATHYIV